MIFGRTYTIKKDADLVALISEGDNRAFRELLNRHQNAVYGFALRLLNGDTQEAEDVAQETFLRLFRVSGNYHPSASLKTFLFRIARNLCIDFFRKKRPDMLGELPDTPEKDTPLDLLEKAIDTDRLEKSIRKLPVNQRTALLLRHNEQMNYNQISEVMNLSISAVESLLVRARQKLRLELLKNKQEFH
ncbi:MAG: sigma-70 family RNA polymerase sigma factor [Deltaproteobacteria bacterium]|nr:sigma-70 family RNA polymerase sigma factor [Deltaproteobacteria bacterium]